MIAALPDPISRAIAAEIATVPPAQLRAAASALSGAYRGKSTLDKALSAASRAAYLAVRFPSTFAVASAVWRELARTGLAAEIRTVLDAGAGPGTASLAAGGFLDAGTRYTQLERDAGWRNTAQRLAAAANIAIDHRAVALAPSLAIDAHDAIVAAYALNELTDDERSAVVDALWRAAKHALIIIEPGTPRGFSIVRAARESVLARGGHAAAPCTHNAPCPMSTDDWCHRPERIARSAAHRSAKDARLGFEDEKFSFVILTRKPLSDSAVGRIVRKPIRNAGHVHLDLCTGGELKRTTVARSDGALYRQARDAAWGEIWPPYDD